jgi:hypothetical protein
MSRHARENDRGNQRCRPGRGVCCLLETAEGPPSSIDVVVEPTGGEPGGGPTIADR